MQAPTASCKVADVTIGNTNVTFAASSLNNASSDNCTSPSSLTYRMCLGATCTTMTPTVSLMKTQIPTGQNQVSLPVKMQVYDACLNASTICNTSITLKRQGTVLSNSTSNSATTITPQDIEASEPSAVSAVHGDLKCFPTAFTDDLNLQYNLTTDVENVVLKVYDNQGRVVAKNAQGEQGAGFYQMRWNLSDLAPAMYHICLEIDGKCMKVERVIMLK
jgi:hypothetical protein